MAIPKALAGANLRVGHKVLKHLGRQRYPGDPIPEAAEWPNIVLHLRNGTIVADIPVSPKEIKVERVREKLAPPVERPAEPSPKRLMGTSPDSQLELAKLSLKSRMPRMKRLAKEAGLEFPSDISKVDLLLLIEKVLNPDEAEDVL